MAHAKISQPQQTEKSDQQSVKQDTLTLGQHIAAVLDHPFTPAKIYNGIVDAIHDLMNRDVHSDAQFIQAVIEKTNELEKQNQAASGLGPHVGVVLTHAGTNKIEAIELVKKVTGLSLEESRDLVDSVPKALKNDVGQEEAEAIKEQFAKIGCTVILGRAIPVKGGAQ